MQTEGRERERLFNKDILLEPLIQTCAMRVLDSQVSKNVCEEVSRNLCSLLKEIFGFSVHLVKKKCPQLLCASDVKKAIHRKLFYHNLKNHLIIDDDNNDVIDLSAFMHGKEPEEYTCVYLNSSQLMLNFEISDFAEVTEELKEYFISTTNAILATDKCEALIDLQDNSCILPLIPYFVHFISVGMKEMHNSMSQLRKFLLVIHFLIQNPHVYFIQESYLNILVHSLLNCIIEPSIASDNYHEDHWSVQCMAANILAEVFKKYLMEVKSIYNNTIFYLESVLRDTAKPFYSHYGVITALIAIDVSAVAKVIPQNLSQYLNHLNAYLHRHDNYKWKEDALLVYHQLLCACRLLIFHCLKYECPFYSPKFSRSLRAADGSEKRRSDVILPFMLSVDFSEYFGDSVAICDPFYQTYEKSFHFTCEKKLLKRRISCCNEERPWKRPNRRVNDFEKKSSSYNKACVNNDKFVMPRNLKKTKLGEIFDVQTLFEQYISVKKPRITFHLKHDILVKNSKTVVG